MYGLFFCGILCQLLFLYFVLPDRSDPQGNRRTKNPDTEKRFPADEAFLILFQRRGRVQKPVSQLKKKPCFLFTGPYLFLYVQRKGIVIGNGMSDVNICICLNICIADNLLTVIGDVHDPGNQFLAFFYLIPGPDKRSSLPCDHGIDHTVQS